MKVVLLCGGLGTRISEESRSRPKPMVELGGMPILWHIMKEYSYFGFDDFVICAGYKQHVIKDWFASYFLRESDVTFDWTGGEQRVAYHGRRCEPWRVTIVDTGPATMTGGRVKRVQAHVGDEPFMVTYGDGVCDVDIADLVAFHRSHGRLATLTTVVRGQTKGVLDIAEDSSVRAFREKAAGDGTPINAGYMVFEPAVFDYLGGDDCVLERGPLERLAAEGQLMGYRHRGFWQCMDNLRERELLERMLEQGTAPWVRWER